MSINTAAHRIGMGKRAVLVSDRPAHPVMRGVARRTGLPVVQPKIMTEPTGTRLITFDRRQTRWKGADAYFVTTCRPGLEYLNQDLMRAADIVGALGETGVRNVILFLLHWPYARQDRKSRPREPISSSAVANFFESLQQWERFAWIGGRAIGIGSRPAVSRIIVVDPHTSPQGFTTIPIEVISGYAALAQYIRPKIARDPSRVAVLSPDEGRLKPARRFAQALFPDLPKEDIDRRVFAAYKVRGDSTEGGQVEQYQLPESLVQLLPSIDDIAIFDDMIDRASTMMNAVEAIRAAQFPTKRVWVSAVHALMSDSAKERIASLGIGKLVVTSSTAIPRPSLPHDTHVVNISSLVAATIRRTFLGGSLEGVELYG